MRKKRPKERVERRKLADGSIKVYRYAARTSKPAEAKTVGALLASWQKSPEWEKFAAATRSNYTIYATPLYDAYKAASIQAIKRRHLLGLRDELVRDRGHGAATAFCRTMQSFFKWLGDREYIDASPATRLEGALERGTLPTWTLEQALLAEEKLPTHYGRAVFLARHTAQRRGDLCALRWSQYDGQTIRLVQQKTKVSLVIPVVPELKAALDDWRREAKGLTILTNAQGQPLNPAGLSHRLPVEMTRLGLPPLGIHGLRKLAAVTLANAGCSTHEIASITGHKTLAMIQRYTEAASQRTLSQAAVSRLVFSQKPQKEENS